MKKDYTGVYCILNTVNGRPYVGSSKGLMHRIRTHRCVLNRGTHFNWDIQREWKRYGQEAFVFAVLELCELEKRAIVEQWWADRLNVFGFGYNIRDCQMVTMHESTRLKISLSHRGLNTWTKGVPRSPEVIARVAAAHVGLKMGMNSRINSRASKLGDKNPKSKLTNSQRSLVVEEFRALRRSGVKQMKACKDLADKYGFSVTGIYKIAIYSHVTRLDGRRRHYALPE